LFYALEALCHHGPQSLAFVGQGQAARQTTKQRFAQAFFEIADVLADGGLRHMQLLCCASQAEMTGGRIKHAQGVQWKLHGMIEIKVFLMDGVNYYCWFT
jgi:hypothetical protein